MNFKINKNIFIFLFLLCLFFLPQIIFATNFTYEPMEEIPGFGRPTSYESYVLAIYKFGLWTVGISAVFMISIGAFMYITSAGNTSQIGKAKEIIFDSIAGVILALTSYVLLYTINPNLVNINSISGTTGTSSSGSTSSGTTSSGSSSSSTKSGYKLACPDTSSTTKIDFTKATSDTSLKLDSNCDKYDFSNTYGVDTCILKAMAQLESSCGANKGESSAHACGLMQLTEATAKTLNDGVSVSCQTLKDDDTLSIKLAAKYVSQNISGSCVGGNQAAVFAGYNSGYGCSTSACSPTKASLCASSDCSGAKAFECCKNPGELEESIDYAWKGMGYYSLCKK